MCVLRLYYVGVSGEEEYKTRLANNGSIAAAPVKVPFLRIVCV